MDRRRAQLARVEAELDEARRRAHAIADPLDSERWTARPAPKRWSVAECLVHLNLTSQAFLPLIDDAIVRGRDGNLLSDAPLRMDVVGRLLWWASTFSLPIKTKDPFVPARVAARDTVLAEYDRLQRELIRGLRNADGLDLGRLRIVSPFDPRIKYHLYSCFRVIPAHQRQHLKQAEGVVRSLRARR